MMSSEVFVDGLIRHWGRLHVRIKIHEYEHIRASYSIEICMDHESQHQTLRIKVNLHLGRTSVTHFVYTRISPYAVG